jgi:replicative DNA helicase
MNSPCWLAPLRSWQLFVVDYIQLVESASVGKGANRETHVSEVARRLKLLTKELQVAVIAMSQLNDEGQLRESRAIGHHRLAGPETYV